MIHVPRILLAHTVCDVYVIWFFSQLTVNRHNSNAWKNSKQNKLYNYCFWHFNTKYEQLPTQKQNDLKANGIFFAISNDRMVKMLMHIAIDRKNVST